MITVKTRFCVVIYPRNALSSRGLVMISGSVVLLGSLPKVTSLHIVHN